MDDFSTGVNGFTGLVPKTGVFVTDIGHTKKFILHSAT